MVLSAVSVLTVTGCQPDEPPTPTIMDTPEIVWDNGIEPSSPLETHPAVQTLRGGYIGIAMASNTGDFTIAQFTDNLTRPFVRGLASSYSESIVLYPGPEPFQPLRIVSEDDKGAVVEICQFGSNALLHGHVGWAITEDFPGAKFDRGVAEVIRVKLSFEDGRLKIPAGGAWEQVGEPCDGNAIPVGRFKDQPVFPDTIPTAPVREPLPTTSK